MKLKDAVIEAMEDYLENGQFRPHNPAIMHCPHSGYYYGSALHAEDAGDDIIMKLDDGFGSWTPESTDDVQVCAAGVAAGAANGL